MRNILLMTMLCLFTISASAQNSSIGGIVYADSANSTQTDSFMVWLISFNSSTNILTAVDSQVISGQGMGSYSFANPANGSYRTKAAHLNGPSSGTGYLPTYHSSTFSNSPLLWSNASVITHTGSNSFGNHIYMAQGTVTSGPGFIGGNVQQGANKGTASGIADMTILLLDASDNPVAFATTDANGDYSFSNLPHGTYKVHPENLGDATTAASVTIDATHVTQNAISFERSNSNKTIVPLPNSIANVAASAISVSVYPNPANNVVNINWANNSNDIASVVITDISGEKVLSTQVSMNANTSINIETLNSGLYFMNIASENGSNTQKLIVQ